MIELPPGPFACVLADPPWKFLTWSKKGRDRCPETRHYDTMNFHDLLELPVKDVTAPDAILFLWVVDWLPLDKTNDLIEAWGFKYKTKAFYWTKTKPSGAEHMTCGYWTRCLHSHAMVTVYDKSRCIVERLALRDLSIRSVSDYMIWTHSGWKQINDIFYNGMQPVTKIVTRIGTTYSTSTHRWAIKYIAQKDRGSVKQAHHTAYLETADIEEMKGRFKYTRNGFNMLFSRLPMESPAPTTCFGAIELTDDIAWMTGLWLAEGNYGVPRTNGEKSRKIRFTIHVDEQQFLQRIRSIIGDLDLPLDRYPIRKVNVGTHQEAGTKRLSIYFSSSVVRSIFDKYITGTGAHGKRLNIPELLQTTSSFRIAFLRGFLDGDGTKGQHGYDGFRDVRLCNPGLRDDLMVLCHSVGVMTSLLLDKTAPAGNGTICHCYGFRFVSPRNKDIVLDGQSVFPVEIKSFANMLSMPTYDLSVDGHAYIADDLITHNSNPEECLLATNGHPKRLDAGVRKWIHSPVREHSRKPDEAYERIERLVAGPRLELFSRTTRPGWTAWGDQAGKFPIETSLNVHN